MKMMNLINLNLNFMIIFMAVSFLFMMIGTTSVVGAPASTIILPLKPPSKVFDVTKYGAVADGKTENSDAFKTAWYEACGYQGISIFWVPLGVYYLKPIEFRGPCYRNRSPRLEIRGTLRAPTTLEAFSTEPTWILFDTLNMLYVNGNGTGLLDAQGEASWKPCGKNETCPKKPYAVRLNRIAYGDFINIGILNGKTFHMQIYRSHKIRVNNVTITAPEDSPNTDGIHIGECAYVNITSSRIGVGDDCISIGPDNRNIIVSDVHCGPGHGISMGSLGLYPDEKELVGVTVKNCTINGTMNGVRIKTWRGSQPSKASNIKFEDIVMINASNPIIIDQLYCPEGGCDSKPPSLVQLSDIEFRNIRGTSNTKAAVKLLCSSAVPCTNVTLADINLINIHGDGPEVSTCSFVNGMHSGVQRPAACI